MKDPKLNKEEQEDLTAIEDAVFESLKNGKTLIDEERLEKLQKAAVNTFKKDERINIRLSKRDLNEIKLEALKLGIPYQTHASSILHQYINRNIK